MAFKKNNQQQISFIDSYDNLTDREKKFLEKSWAKSFSDHVFPAIDEERFAVLYSTIASRPNTPINVIIGALILKELLGLTDDEVLDSLLFDIRFQYALHTTSFEEQPLSDRSLGRFRERCLTYERETGIDLIKDCMLDLTDVMASIMGISGSVKRMDSLMVASNIKKLSRLELLYKCVARFVNYLDKNKYEIPKELHHYTEKTDNNKFIYHQKNIDINERFALVLKDAKYLIENYCDECHESREYQILIRVIGEQTLETEDGDLALKTAQDGMDSSILQSPTDPEATYRKKAGQAHSGYVANVVEDLGEDCSLITDYDYQTNTYSDSRFMKDTIEQIDTSDGKEVVVLVDGAYGGTENHEMASEKNIKLVTTNFTGRKPPAVSAGFEFSEDGKSVLKCANNHSPLTTKYNSKSGQCRITMDKDLCNSCPLKDECKPKYHKTKTSKSISWKSAFNAKQMKFMKTEEFKSFAKVRNGVEAIPSVMRRKYGVDEMPVRGRLAGKLYLGFKLLAFNCKKLHKKLCSLASNTQNEAIA